MTFKELQSEILSLANVPNVDFFTMGYSTLGKPIYCFHVGSYEGRQMIVEGAIHAREYITALFLVEEIKYLSTKTFRGGIYFIPLMNPDGVQLVLDGTSGLPCTILQKYLLLVNNENNNFSRWKANINAVDLNVNFNADWGQGIQNVFCPAPANFVGYYPESERETRELISFTNKIRPALTLSYHSKGEVIFYGFTGLTDEQLSRDLKIAEAISEANGYAIIKTEGSVGGYSDWVSRNLGVPAFTIEVGSEKYESPLPLDLLPSIFEKNKDVPLIALRAYENILTTNKVFSLFKNPFLCK